MGVDPNVDNAYIAGMAVLNIRNLPDEMHRRLRVRAAEHGRSMEAEARAILAEALAGDARTASSRESTSAKVRELQAFIDKLYGGNKPKNVVDEFIAERRREAAREEAE
jgi:plasmid stability protein